jgi:clathrin heavy chain
MNHPVEAWENGAFKDAISKVHSSDIHLKAVRFYMQEHPLLVNDLLQVLMTKVDHARIIAVVKEQANGLALVKAYLLAAQQENNQTVNEALNGLFIEEEDYEALKVSIASFDNFDNIGLAKALEQHELLEFRRIAAELYRKNQKWNQSIELSKQDKLFEDSMRTAFASRSQELCEELLKFFVHEHRSDCFATCLYICHDFIRPDIVLELSWKNKLLDFAMPFFIQVMRDYTSRVDQLTQVAATSSGLFHVGEISSSDNVFPNAHSNMNINDDPHLFPNMSEGFFPQGVFQQGSMTTFPSDSAAGFTDPTAGFQQFQQFHSGTM